MHVYRIQLPGPATQQRRRPRPRRRRQARWWRTRCRAWRGTLASGGPQAAASAVSACTSACNPAAGAAAAAPPPAAAGGAAMARVVYLYIPSGRAAQPGWLEQAHWPRSGGGAGRIPGALQIARYLPGFPHRQPPNKVSYWLLGFPGCTLLTLCCYTQAFLDEPSFGLWISRRPRPGDTQVCAWDQRAPLPWHTFLRPWGHHAPCCALGTPSCVRGASGRPCPGHACSSH